MGGRHEAFLVAGCALLLLLQAAAVTADSQNSSCRVYDCPNFRTIYHYEQLGCRRSDDSDECCPTRFNCSSLLSLEKTKCHYKGKVYDPGTIIRDEISFACLPSCECIGDEEGTSNGEAKFNCTHIKCPNTFLTNIGCSTIFNFDQCCSTGRRCGKPDKEVPECTYNGKKYYEGDYIDAPDCQRCICQAGFNGTLDGPWCRKESCEYHLARSPSVLASCAPIYWSYTKCCPIRWHCPSPNDTVIRQSEPPTDDDEHCSFGDHRLKIGDELRSHDCPYYVKCRCDIPPFLTCDLTSFKECITVIDWDELTK